MEVVVKNKESRKMVQISIIMSAYNAEKYLREALDSISRQTFQDFQLVFINDGSIDSTEEILKEYFDTISIKYIYQDNHGLAYSRNVGVLNAEGRYVTFVDADDVIHEEYLEKLYKLSQLTESQVVYVKHQFFEKEIPLIYRTNRFSTLSNVEALKWYFCSKTGIVCSGIFDKKLISEVKFPIGRIYEDNIVKTYCLENAKRVTISDDILYFYRRNEDGITLSKTNQKIYDMFVIGKMVRKILKNDMTIWKKIKQDYYICWFHCEGYALIKGIFYIRKFPDFKTLCEGFYILFFGSISYIKKIAECIMIKLKRKD